MGGVLIKGGLSNLDLFLLYFFSVLGLALSRFLAWAGFLTLVLGRVKSNDLVNYRKVVFELVGNKNAGSSLTDLDEILDDRFLIFLVEVCCSLIQDQHGGIFDYCPG